MTTIDILGSIKALAIGAVRLVILNIAVIIGLIAYPVLMVVLPLYLIHVSPSADRTGLAQLIFWTAPLSCAFWMCFSCHLHSVRQWRRMGRLSQWREDHGGYAHTLAKSFLFMLIGFVASYATQVAFIYAFSLVSHSVPQREALGFILFPLGSFAPVILLWLKRRNYHEALPGEEFGVVYPDAVAHQYIA